MHIYSESCWQYTSEFQKVETTLSVHKIKWWMLTMLKNCNLIQYFMPSCNSFQTTLILYNRTQLCKASKYHPATCKQHWEQCVNTNQTPYCWNKQCSPHHPHLPKKKLITKRTGRSQTEQKIFVEKKPIVSWLKYASC